MLLFVRPVIGVRIEPRENYGSTKHFFKHSFRKSLVIHGRVGAASLYVTSIKSITFPSAMSAYASAVSLYTSVYKNHRDRTDKLNCSSSDYLQCKQIIMILNFNDDETDERFLSRKYSHVFV